MFEGVHPGVIKRMTFCIALVLLGLFIPVAAYQGLLRPENELINVWFQRSGSLMIFIAVLVEYNLLRLQENVILTGMVKPSEKHPTECFTPLYKMLQFIVALLAIGGTIIWGYGDILSSKT